MTKYEWESELKKNIHRLPDDEIKRVLEYYGELFEDNIERGKSESAIISEFGNPVDVAYRIMTEYDGELKPDVFDTPPMRRDDPPIFDPPKVEPAPVQPTTDPPSGGAPAVAAEKRSFGRMPVVLVAFIVINIVTGFAPIFIALSVWIVLGALVAAGVATTIGGVVAVIVSAGQLFTGVPSGLAQLGMSMVAIGIGIVMALLVIQLMKLYGKLSVNFFKLLAGKE